LLLLQAGFQLLQAALQLRRHGLPLPRLGEGDAAATAQLQGSGRMSTSVGDASIEGMSLKVEGMLLAAGLCETR
jgi:hypothetical protein